MASAHRQMASAHRQTVLELEAQIEALTELLARERRSRQMDLNRERSIIMAIGLLPRAQMGPDGDTWIKAKSVDEICLAGD